MAAYRWLFAAAENAVRMLTRYRFVPGQDRPDQVYRSWFHKASRFDELEDRLPPEM